MRHKHLHFLLILIAAILLISAGPVIAQTTTTVQFTPSAEHSLQVQGVNVVDRYELVVTPSGGAPRAPHNLNKPDPVSGTISVNISTYVNSLPAGSYTAIVQAVGPGGVAGSPPSAPFGLTVPRPSAPATAPVIIRQSQP